ncbi:MAG TPA: flagellar hook capping FlgD N-terminal domain-containing protein [Oligoflexia bacterium]|nr:flagellar hook capping FlgD N-terminal domain-containing protein [Oligoflexia bacterium]HMP48997.1 flagellar hook capping FlgD N-terminal domain-containing protein [Oligoflexia bacterium]
MTNPIFNNLKSGATPVNSGANAQGTKDVTGKSSTISQNEFLTLLVTQLQNQDPLNPMENEEFAVQLATFSQLEQLVQINEKMDGRSGAGDGLGSMASYLGHEVEIPGGKVEVQNGRGSNLYANIPAGTESVRVDLRNAEGVVVSSSVLNPVPGAGSQVIPLTGINAPNGAYDVRVVSVGADGRFVDIPTRVTGTVEGFVMEPEPKLIVAGREFGLDEIKAVYNGK